MALRKCFMGFFGIYQSIGLDGEKLLVIYLWCGEVSRKGWICGEKGSLIQTDCSKLLRRPHLELLLGAYSLVCFVLFFYWWTIPPLEPPIGIRISPMVRLIERLVLDQRTRDRGRRGTFHTKDRLNKHGGKWTTLSLPDRLIDTVRTLLAIDSSEFVSVGFKLTKKREGGGGLLKLAAKSSSGYF